METYNKISELRYIIQARQSRYRKVRTILLSLAVIEFFVSMTLLALVKW